MWRNPSTVGFLTLILCSFCHATPPLPDNILELAINAQKQQVEIVWQDLDIRETSVIRLTNGPIDSINTKILVEFQPSARNGWNATNLYYDYSHFRKIINLETKCYGYWAYHADKSNNTIYKSTCMRPFQRWMNEMKPLIESSRFRDLFIPGTHDSGAYKLDFNPNVNYSSRIDKYTFTQDEDIYGQLLHGVRYLDIRPAYYKFSKPQFWVNHGVVKLHPMDQVLKDVYRFVQETNEIVCVDFHNFELGFDKDETHRNLVKFVYDLIGDQVIDLESLWDSSLAQIWAQPKRIIFAYNYKTIAMEHAPITWEGVRQRWAQADEKSKLKEFLFKVNDQDQNLIKPVADMVQLTPTPAGIVLDKYKGLRKMADNVNRDVSEWYFKDLGWKANIVAADFFRGTTIVQNAIWINQVRANNRKNMISV